MSKSIPPFEVSAANTVVDYSVTPHEVAPGWAHIHWVDHDGNRYGTAVIPKDGKWVLREHRPLGHAVGRTYVTKNPPLNDEGKHRSRYDDGYFPTRYLDPNAAAHRHIVEAALAWVNGSEDPINADSRRQIEKEIADVKAADEGHAAKIKQYLLKFADELPAADAKSKLAAEQLATYLDVEQLNLLSRRIHGF